jgi:structural maintenance of chromosome 4
LEDIIGTIRYKPMLEAISVDIDKVNEVRAEKVNRVNNLQKDKQALEGPKNEAISYLKVENDLITKKNCFYQIKT